MSSNPERSTALPPAARGSRSDVLSDVRGVSQLVVGAVAGVTDVVEDVHRTIAGLSPIVGASTTGRARGIAGFVYRSVRGVTHAVGFGLDTALAHLAPWPSSSEPSTRREATLAALNGVFGDRLAATSNPLAITMHLRHRGDRERLPGGRLLVLVHGLCMSDLAWQRDGHDHGAALAQDLGFTPVYLRYNSGLRIATNGREFADLLERLVETWPTPISELVVVGHSMGGLVARSACHHAAVAGHAWLRSLTSLVFLGTPHHGAPLERAGHRFNALVGVSPYSAPFARLGEIRSAGVKDLRHGTILSEDVGEHIPAGGPRGPAPLPEGVRCFAIAATRRGHTGEPGRLLPGDGLVPVASALGRHEDPSRTLPIPAAHQSIHHGLSHFDLLSSRAVYDRLRRWLAAG